MMSGVMPNCSWQKNVPLRPMPAWTSSRTMSALCLRHSVLRLEPELVGREVDALALDGLDHEGGHVAAPQLAGQGADVAERDHVGSREQRTEPAAELAAAVQGERAGREAVEGVVAVEDAGPLGGGAGELDRALDRLGARVGEEDPLDAGVRPLDQLFGQDAGQEGAVHLHEVGQVGVERVVERLHDGRMAPAEGEDAEAGEEVEVPITLRRR